LIAICTKLHGLVILLEVIRRVVIILVLKNGPKNDVYNHPKKKLIRVHFSLILLLGE
jgi:hypothetical protein